MSLRTRNCEMFRVERRVREISNNFSLCQYYTCWDPKTTLVQFLKPEISEKVSDSPEVHSTI